MFNKILFGKDKKGGFKVWSISAMAVGDAAQVVVVHGKEGGKMQEKVEAVKAGKQGRTPLEQAISQAEGKIKKQVDKGYRENKADLDDLPLLAMLAADYRKQGHRIEYPCYTSVKYDGVRCLAKRKNGVITLESRTGQPYDVPHIVEALSFMKEGWVLDGELYLHGESLQDITSAVKRTRPWEEVEDAEAKLEKAKGVSEEAHAEAITELNAALNIQRIRENLEFHVFDIPSDMDFTCRLEQLVWLNDNFIESIGKLYVTGYATAFSEADMKEQHKQAVAQGYEGIMLRNFQGVYESGKRSADLQKYKEFMDAEFRIVGNTRDKDGLVVYTCRNDVNDEEFNVTIGSHEERQNVVDASWLTVKFQSRYKGTLLPQFPTGVAFRACDEAGNPVD